MSTEITENTENREEKIKVSSSVFSVFSVIFVFVFVCEMAGCSAPSAANNQLRVENQKLQNQIDTHERDKTSARATIEALQRKVGSVPTLPQERLDKLFTVAGLKLGRLTGGANWDPSKPGDNGVKVEVVPIDGQGEKLKAAGSFTIDVFDLAEAGDTHIAHGHFTVDQARKQWFGSGLLYAYVLKCPWEKVPAHSELTIRVTYHDELTGREFTQQQVVKVNPPVKSN
jgi:outer membrane murein-binding lipoprotein Lpp